MLANISVWQLGIVLLIVVLIFGTKKLRNLGEDVGGGIRGIRDGFGGDLGEAAREVGQVKKSLEELRDDFQQSTKDSGSSSDINESEGSGQYYTGQPTRWWDGE